jgi:predicted NBD/HSP70 family sugar kinase
MDLRSTRDTNRLKVLEALHRRPGSSRLELAEQTRLSRPTVSTLLDELERLGVVAPYELPGEAVGGAVAARGAGRPPELLAIAPRAAFAVGADIGHAHLRVAVCDLAGAILAEDFAPAVVDHAPEATLDRVASMVAGVLARAGVAHGDVLGAGVALAAPVDRATGAVSAQGILQGWDDTRPRDALAARLGGLPVTLENDANLGALGERAFGVARGVEDMAYVRLSAGIGLGLILHGTPYRGASGIAGELGHVPAVDDGPVCRCGKRGCLETVATPDAIARQVSLARGAEVDVRGLLTLLAAGDPDAQAAVADAGRAVGRALAMLVNVLNPRLVVLGGELAQTGDTLLGAVRATLDHDAVAPSAAAVTVTAGTLGDRAEVLGAAGAVIEDAPAALAVRAARAMN